MGEKTSMVERLNSDNKFLKFELEKKSTELTRTNLDLKDTQQSKETSDFTKQTLTESNYDLKQRLIKADEERELLLIQLRENDRLIIEHKTKEINFKEDL